MKYDRIAKQVGFNYVIIALGMVIAALLPVVLTRNLSKQEYGVYSLFYSTVKLAILLLEFALVQYIVTRLAIANKTERIRKFLSVARINLILLVIFIVLAALTPVKEFFLRTNKLIGYDWIYYVCIIITVLGVVTRLVYGYFFAKKEINKANTIDFFQNNLWFIGVVVFGAIIGGINLGQVFLIGTLTLAAVLIVGILLFVKELPSLKTIRFFDNKSARQGLLFSLPLIPGAISGWIIGVSDRFVINFLESQEQVAIYTLPYSILGIVLTLGGITTGVLYPYFVEHLHKQSGKQYVLQNAALKFGLIIVLPSTVGLIIMRKAIITLVSGWEYLPSAELIPYLAAYPLLAFLSTMAFQHAMSRNRTKAIGLIYVIGAVMNILLNFILIAKYSLVGAAVATLISYAFITIALFLMIKDIKIMPAYLRLERIILACIIMGLTVNFMNPQTVIMKIVTIITGAVFYGALLLLMKVFSKDEISVAAGLLPWVKKQDKK